MSMQDVVEGIRQDFIASGCIAPVFFGKQYLEDSASAPRIVIVPTTDRYTPPTAINASIQPQVGLNPRPYWTRFAGCDVHIWAAAEPQPDGKDQLLADYGAIDRLLNQFVMSLTRVTNAITIDAGDWASETVHVRSGLVCLVKATIEFPIVAVPFGGNQTYEEVSGVHADITVELDNPGPPQRRIRSINFSTTKS